MPTFDIYEDLEKANATIADLEAQLREKKPQWSKEWPTEPGWYWFYEPTMPRCPYPIHAYYLIDGLLVYEEEDGLLEPTSYEAVAFTPAHLPDVSGAVVLLEDNGNAGTG